VWLEDEEEGRRGRRAWELANAMGTEKMEWV
jgi:hypothetical protein